MTLWTGRWEVNRMTCDYVSFFEHKRIDFYENCKKTINNFTVLFVDGGGESVFDAIKAFRSS